MVANLRLRLLVVRLTPGRGLEQGFHPSEVLIQLGPRVRPQQLRDRLSGLAQPQYVIDIPGGVSKALASPADVETESGGVRLRGRDGAWRDYP